MRPFKVDAEGNLVYKPDGKDGYIAGLENGKTYKVSVRAVNRNSAMELLHMVNGLML